MKFVEIKSRPRFIFSSLILLISFLMSSVQGVKASSIVPAPLSPLATAFPTLTPIGVMPTSVSLDGAIDFSCPAGVPAGYGTTTPSVDWLYACGQCLPTGTPQAFYTSTLGPTATPVWPTSVPPVCMTAVGGGPEVCYTASAPASPVPPTVTALPSPTSTIVSTPATNQIYCSRIDGCEQVNTTTVRKLFSGSLTSGMLRANLYFKRVNISAPVYYTISDQTISVINTDTHGHTSKQIKLELEYWGAVRRAVNFLYNTPQGMPIGQTFTYTASPVQYSNSATDTASTEMHADLVASQPWGFQDGNTFNFTYSFYLYASTVSGAASVPTVTPSPTVTPVGSAFCDSISNSNVPNQFEFGGGEVVYQECISTPEISLSAILDIFPTWITPLFFTFLDAVLPDFTIDPLTVCTRTRDFGLYIFGYRMPMEFIIGLVIFLSGLRFFVPTVFSGASVIGQNTPTVSQTHSVSTTSRSGSTRTTNTTTTTKKGKQ